MNKVSDSVNSKQGQKILAVSNSLRNLSNVDKSRLTPKYAKPCKFYIKRSPEQGAVLTSPYLWKFFCKDQTKNRELFDIQIIGIEQEGSPTKETLWKR